MQSSLVLCKFLGIIRHQPRVGSHAIARGAKLIVGILSRKLVLEEVTHHTWRLRLVFLDLLGFLLDLVSGLLGDVHQLESLPVCITEDETVFGIWAPTVWRGVTIFFHHPQALLESLVVGDVVLPPRTESSEDIETTLLIHLLLVLLVVILLHVLPHAISLVVIFCLPSLWPISLALSVLLRLYLSLD